MSTNTYVAGSDLAARRVADADGLDLPQNRTSLSDPNRAAMSDRSISSLVAVGVE